MVDIHSHILWDLDDGSKTLEESLEMLRIAASSGTTDIVATPHANSRYPFSPIVKVPKYVRVDVNHGCRFSYLQCSKSRPWISRGSQTP